MKPLVMQPSCQITMRTIHNEYKWLGRGLAAWFHLKPPLTSLQTVETFTFTAASRDDFTRTDAGGSCFYRVLPNEGQREAVAALQDFFWWVNIQTHSQEGIYWWGKNNDENIPRVILEGRTGRCRSHLPSPPSYSFLPQCAVFLHHLMKNWLLFPERWF